MSNNTLTRFRKANQTQISDTTRRFGYSGGTPMMAMDANKSGLEGCNPIRGGELLLFVYNPKAAGYIGGGVDMFTGERKKQYVPLYPRDYQTVVDRAFHTNDDLGYRNLDMLTAVPMTVTDTEYSDDADKYFSVVHPRLSDCPYGLNQPVQLSDPEVGDSTPVYQHCPTCQLADLRSDACSQRIYEASATLDSQILADLRATLIEANEAALRHVERKSSMVQSDIARKMTGTQAGRNVLNAIDHLHFKMMHKEENAATNTSAEMIRGLAQEMANAMRQPTAVASTLPEGAKVMSAEEVAEYEAYKARKEQMAKARAAKEVANDSSNN